MRLRRFCYNISINAQSALIDAVAKSPPQFLRRRPHVFQMFTYGAYTSEMIFILIHCYERNH